MNAMVMTVTMMPPLFEALYELYFANLESLRDRRLRTYGCAIDRARAHEGIGRTSLCMFVIKDDDDEITWDSDAMQKEQP